MFFINYAPKFKYQNGRSKVNQNSGYREIRASLGEVSWPSYISSALQHEARTQNVLCPMQSRLVHVRNILSSSANLKHFCEVQMCIGKSVPNKPFRKIMHQWCLVKVQHVKQCKYFKQQVQC